MKNYFTLFILLCFSFYNGQNAIQFNGTNAYVTFGNNANLGLANFSLECWFKRLGSGATTSTGTGGITGVPLISKGRGESDGSNLDMNYFLGIRQTDSTLVADFEEGSAGTTPGLNHPIVGVTKLARNTWYHVAVTYNGSTWKLYLNGQLENQVTVSQPVQHLSIQHSAIASAQTSNGTAQGFFHGIIDEVRIWNTARTQTQIVSVLNAAITSTVTNLVARWGFNEGSGTNVVSSAGTTINGTITGANWSWVTQQAPFNLNIPPYSPTSVFPLDSTKCANASTKLAITATDANGDSLWVKFYGRPKSNTKDFSIIPLPDTQYYTSQINGANNGMYKSQMNWVVAKKDSLNVQFISGLGDCVENGDNGGNDVEWKRADTAMKIVETFTTPLFASGIPYGLNVGNHDQSPGGNPNGTTTFFNQYFGISRFSGRSYWGGNYGSNADNSYQLFTAEGIDFLVINLEYDQAANPAVLSWAANLVQTYSSRKVIVASHWFLNLDGSYSAQGLATYNALKSYPNFFLMLCGHVAGESRRTDVYNGNTVHCVMSDYQGRTNGGNGWIRIMKFKPSVGKIYVSTYSPYLKQSETDADSQFILDYDFGPAYSLIDSVKVASGQLAQRSWTNVLPSGNYQWYAKIKDGTSTITSPTYEFKTKAYLVVLPNDSTHCGPLTVSVKSGNCLGCSSYTWMNGANTNSLSISSNSQVIVNVSDSLNCQSSDTMNVVIINIPSQPSPIIGDFNPCSGSGISYSVSQVPGASNYNWTLPSGWNGTLTLNSIAVISGTTNGLIQVSAVNICGTSQVRTLQVNAGIIPAAPQAISGSTNICFGSPASIYSVAAVPGAINYSWNNPATWTGTSSVNTITISPTSSGNLSVASSNSCGTSVFQILNIILNPLPTVSISSINNTVCSGNTVILQSSGASTYSWNNSTNNSSISVTPTANVSYTVIGVDNNGCTGNAAVSLTVMPLPTVAISGPNTVCFGSILNLSGSGALSYNWSNSMTSTVIAVTPTNNTSYTLTGLDIYGCSNSAIKQITVNPQPTITANNGTICPGYSFTISPIGASTYTYSGGSNVVSPLSNTQYSVSGTSSLGCVSGTPVVLNINVTNTLTLSISGQTAICSGQNANLTATGANSYTWSTGATSNTISIAPTANTSYTVLGASPTCSNTKVYSLVVNSLPVVSIAATQTAVCVGKTVVLTANGSNSYMWNTGTSNNSISVSPQSSTTFTLTGYSASGCSSTSTQFVKVNSLPVVNAVSSSTNFICGGETTTLTATGGTSYLWSNGAATNTISDNPVMTTSYSVKGIDVNGCENQAAITQNVSECTNLKMQELMKEELNLFPNPNNGSFILKLNKPGDFRIEIYSALGQQVYAGEVNPSALKINLEGGKGIYFYSIWSGRQNVANGKVIVE